MSDIPGANSAEAPAALTEAQAIEAFQGLLEEERAPPQRPQRARASDVPTEAPEPPGPGDAGPEPAPSDDEEEAEPPDSGDGEETEPPEPSEVKPPNGLTPEEKALFRELPPALQQAYARRENDRDRAFTQKTQELAQHRQAIEAAVSETQSERSRYAENLMQLMRVASPEAAKFAEIDWQRLAQEQPAEYVKLSAERDALRGRIGAIQQEITRVQQQQMQAQAQQFAYLQQVEAQRLVEALPDFGDPVKGPRKQAEMRDWLIHNGFTAEEIGQVADHRIIKVIDIAMRVDRQAQARRTAEQQQVRTAPSVQPPGSGRQRGDTTAAQQHQQQMARLRRTGSPDDAIAIFKRMLG